MSYCWCSRSFIQEKNAPNLRVGRNTTLSEHLWFTLLQAQNVFVYIFMSSQLYRKEKNLETIYFISCTGGHHHIWRARPGPGACGAPAEEVWGVPNRSGSPRRACERGQPAGGQADSGRTSRGWAHSPQTGRGQFGLAAAEGPGAAETGQAVWVCRSTALQQVNMVQKALCRPLVIAVSLIKSHF